MYMNKRHQLHAKLFYMFTLLGLLAYIILAYYSLQSSLLNISQVKTYQENAVHNMSNLKQSIYDFKYILIWTFDDENTHIKEGATSFIENNCRFTNCYISSNKRLLSDDYKNFDAIIFNVSIIRKWRTKKFPKRRSARQKYIFYGMESSVDNPICDIHADNFFNWTWSYKLYSDIFTPFIEVLDKKRHVIAPKREVVWQDNSDEVGVVSRHYNLTSKSKDIAWIINKCEGLKSRIMFVEQFKDALVEQFRKLDIYGCDYLECPNRTLSSCLEMIKDKYYYYLAYEDNMSNDYVSTEVINAYDYDAIPIVMGGSDYSKFLPDESYIYARHVEPDKLSATIDYIIRNPDIYKRFFRWKKYYTIKKKDQGEGFCQLCEQLNSASFNEYSNYETFRNWWYQGVLKEKCYPKSAENYKELLSYMIFNSSNSSYNTESKELFHRSIKLKL